MTSENNAKSTAAISAIKSYKERPFVKHQWEELVQHLYQMNDPQLIEMVSRENNNIRPNELGFKLR